MSKRYKSGRSVFFFHSSILIYKKLGYIEDGWEQMAIIVFHHDQFPN